MSPVAPEVPRAFARAALHLLVLFGVVFYGCDWLVGLQDRRVRLHMAWELSIPFWPAAFPVYFSVLALPFVMLRAARSGAEVDAWRRRMALVVVTAGVCFIALPAEPAYARAEPGAWWPWAELARLIAGRHNLLPSLHVALAAVTVAAALPGLGAWARRGLVAWLVLLVASVLLTHQHHVADVVSGLVLAAAVSLPGWRARGR